MTNEEREEKIKLLKEFLEKKGKPQLKNGFRLMIRFVKPVEISDRKYVKYLCLPIRGNDLVIEFMETSRFTDDEISRIADYAERTTCIAHDFLK